MSDETTLKITKLGFSWPIHDGESIRVMQEQGWIPWNDETNAIADALDANHSPAACRRAAWRLMDMAR